MAAPTNPGGVVSLMLDGLAVSNADSTATFTWAGSSYTCTAGPEFDEQNLDEGGFKTVRKLSIAVKVGDLPDGVGLPKKGHLIEYLPHPDADPRSYRIKQVTDFYGSILQLECEDANASA